MFKTLCVVSLILVTSPVFAAINLSVTPSEGGSTLRFGQVDSNLEINKEVRIRITSNDHQQYQVFQRMIDPLVNEKGSFLDHNALSTYTIPGSNAIGTLYAQEKNTLGSGDQLLYTSSPDGDSDSIAVIYSTNQDQMKESGQYMGKLAYTVRPIGGSPQQDVFLDVTLESSVTKSFEIEASSGKNAVRLSNRAISDHEGSIKIHFSGNSGPMRITEEIEDYPKNDLNEEVNMETVQFMTTGSEKEGIRINDWVPLSPKRTLIYDSQEESDNFYIYFKLDEEKLASQQSGDFKGKIKLTVEQNSTEDVVYLDFGIYINPIFKLDVQFPKDGIRFFNLLPNAPPQTKEVIVKVNTNLGKPYAVLQSINSTLINEKGEKINKEFFSMKVEPSDEKTGKSEFPDFSSISESEVPIFFSDAKGSSAEFKVIYQLRPYPDMISGEYSAAFVYSLNQL